LFDLERYDEAVAHVEEVPGERGRAAYHDRLGDLFRGVGRGPLYVTSLQEAGKKLR